MKEYIDRENLKDAFIELMPYAVSDVFNNLPVDIDSTTVFEIIDEAPAVDVAPVNQWISVKDRLPDKDTVVLVISKGGIMMTGRRVRYNKKKDYYEAYFLCNYLGHITHWQPLPQPPTESEG